MRDRGFDECVSPTAERFSGNPDRLTEWNFPGEPPQFVLSAGEGLNTERAERDLKLAQAGARFSPEYFVRAYDFEPGEVTTGGPDSLRAARNRSVVLPDVFCSDLQGQVRAASATVSGLASLDQVQDIIDSLHRALASGQPFAAWKRDLLASGKDFGLAAHRLETIFRTNLQSWYGEGRADAIRRNKDVFPCLRYSAILDARTRPSHARLHGLILPVDDPFWRTHYPPCGYKCRCQVIPMTERAALSAIAKAREKGNAIDEVPTDLPPVDPGWDYDRLQAGAPLDGLGRAMITPRCPVSCWLCRGKSSLGTEAGRN